MKLKLTFKEATLLPVSGVVVYAYDRGKFYIIAPGEDANLRERSVDLATNKPVTFSAQILFYDDLSFAVEANKDIFITMYENAKKSTSLIMNN